MKKGSQGKTDQDAESFVGKRCLLVWDRKGEHCSYLGRVAMSAPGIMGDTSVKIEPYFFFDEPHWPYNVWDILEEPEFELKVITTETSTT